MPRYQYPTSIRLSATDKRRIQRFAKVEKRSTAGLIQAILSQWLDLREKRDGKKASDGLGSVQRVETPQETTYDVAGAGSAFEGGREGESESAVPIPVIEPCPEPPAEEPGSPASAEAPKSFSPPPRKYQE